MALPFSNLWLVSHKLYIGPKTVNESSGDDHGAHIFQQKSGDRHASPAKAGHKSPQQLLLTQRCLPHCRALQPVMT